MCTRNAEYRSQEKLEAESVPSLRSGSWGRWGSNSSPAAVCRYAPPPGHGPHPAHGGLQHTCWSRLEQSAQGMLRLKSPILEPPSPKNPIWKLCRTFPGDNSSLAPRLPPGFRDAAQHNNHYGSLSCDLEMSWSSLPPPSSSALELQQQERGDIPPQFQIPSCSTLLAALAGTGFSVHELALSWMDLIRAGGSPNKSSSIIGP